MRWIEVAALAGVLAACVGIYFWLRRPPDPHDSVSTAWRDDHIRDRRED